MKGMISIEKSFLTSIHDHQRIIYKVCKMYRDGKEDQQDLFQEVVYQLWKSYPTFKGESKISSWIYRIALNTAMAIYRKRRPAVEYVEEIPEKFYSEGDKDSSGNEDLLFAALRTLSDSEKALMSLYLEDFSYQEIAGIMGISESNAGVRLNRIKNKLKQILK